MANLINNQNNIIRAGKFVATGTSPLSLKRNLKTLTKTISEQSNNALLAYVRDASSDGKITVAEKAGLSREWENVRTGFAAITKNAKDAGIDMSCKEYTDLKASYDELSSLMSEVLRDMSVDTDIDVSFTFLFNQYSINANVFSGYMMLAFTDFLDEAYGYSFELACNPSSLSPNGKVTLTAFIKRDGEDVTSQLMNDNHETDSDGSIYYPSLFRWQIFGLKDSVDTSRFLGKRQIEITSSMLDSDMFSASFNGVLDI